MKRQINFHYFNQRLNLGMVDVKQVYQLGPEPTRLNPEVSGGKLVYRASGSSRRVAKEGL